MAAKKHDVFISYAHGDMAAAEAVHSLIEGGARSRSIWRDIRSQLPGDRIPDEVDEALRGARAVVILWSEKSATSEWVRHEAAYALTAGTAVAVRIDAVKPETLPPRQRELFIMDLTELLRDPTRFFEKLDELANRVIEPEMIQTDLLPRSPNAFIARDAELATLADAWESRAPKVVSLIAAGGTGKTALASAFVDRMAAEGWRGAEAVYAFSFDSQGTDEKRQGSSDRFFSEALSFFGEDPDALKDVAARARRFGAILQEKRTLLVLDGVEPMQTPHGNENGRFRDDAMRQFLLDLSRTNAGLCVVTSRLPLADLAGRDARLFAERRLPNLPLADAVELLRLYGVDYTQDQMQSLCRDFGEAPRDHQTPGETGFRCHAKAIALIGAFIKLRYAGVGVRPTYEELLPAFDMPDDLFLGVRDDQLKDEPGYAVYKMIRRYEILYKDRVTAAKKAEAMSQAGRQLMLMRLMGLFDRPASWGALRAVLASPPIPGLTERLDAVTQGEWIGAINALREDGMLNPPPPGAPSGLEDDHVLDAHPLIREYFKRRLEVSAPEAAREAHRRLYDFYRYQGLPAAFQEKVAYGLLGLKTGYSEHFDMLWNGLLDGSLAEGYRVQIPPSVARADQDALKVAAQLIDGPEWREALTAFLPTDEAGMLPLFAAIAHGCAAGQHNDAFAEVYRPRVARGNEGYAVHKLGLYGSELSAVAHFFAEPFAEPAEGLPPARQALLFNLAGFALRALGRLSEAVAPFRGGMQMGADQEDWEGAAADASSLSELLLVLGRLGDAPSGAAGAVSTAAQSVAYADRSGDAFERMSNRTTHADALHHQGDLAGAARLFEEAEALQRERQPDLPLLYSLPGARWCDLKLAQGRREEAQARAEYALPLGQRNNWLVDIGLNTLTLGRAAHHRAREGASRFPEALALLDRAVEALLAAGTGDQIPKGYLARAACRREAGDAAGAAQDLDAARDIARRGGMRLFLVDCAGEAAWRALEREDLDAASKEIAFVGQEIEAIGYGRRKPDLALLRATLAGVKGNREAALMHFEPLLAAMRKDNLWSFLPDLDQLAELFEIPELDEMRAELRRERAAFDAAEDAKFEQARAYPEWLDDAAMDARLADPEFRAELARAMQANSMPDLDTLPFAQQRDYARRYVAQTQPQRAQQPPEAPPALPDEIVDALLANEEIRAQLARIYAENNIDAPVDDIPRKLHATVLAQMVAEGAIKIEEQPPAPEGGAKTSAASSEPAPKPRRSWRERLGLKRRGGGRSGAA